MNRHLNHGRHGEARKALKTAKVLMLFSAFSVVIPRLPRFYLHEVNTSDQLAWTPVALVMYNFKGDHGPVREAEAFA